MAEDIYLREVTEEDVELIFKWANDKVVRENSFSTETISMDNHRKWFNNVLLREYIRLFVMVVNGTPVGQVRITIEGNVAELGYSIADEYRGKGYGRKIIELMIDKIHKGFPDIDIIIGRVKKENIPSQRVFQGLGFNKEGFEYSLLINR